MNISNQKKCNLQYDIAFAYAKDHIDEIPVADNAEYISYSDNFEREDIDFEDEE